MLKLKEDVNKRDLDLRQVKAKLSQIEEKAKRVDDLEKKLVELRNLHSAELNQIKIQVKGINLNKDNYTPFQSDHLSIELANMD